MLSKQHQPGVLKKIGKSAEVAVIFRRFGREFLHHGRLSAAQQDIMKAIMSCRTRVLGGHREQCDSCHHQQNVFISCRDRHCPKCQTTVKAKWLQARTEELLPVPYFHLVFTLPHELNPIALYNKKAVANILFRAVSKTLMDFAKTSRLMPGGNVGFLAILHTWDQKLLPHYHLHCLLPAGVLSSDCTMWVHAKKNFLFPVKALSTVFRGKFIAYLTQAVAKQELIVPENSDPGDPPEAWESLSQTLWQKKWVVYAKPALDQPDKVLDYLGRYVHRIAIANHRILSVDTSSVTFRCKDRKRKRTTSITLPGPKFIQRFMLHTMPKQFRRIRSYGFLANRSKKKKLKKCRELMGVTADPKPKKKSTMELICDILGFDITICPRCHKGKMQIMASIAPVGANMTIDELFNNPTWFDTS